MPSPDNDEIIEISKTAHARLMTVAGPASRLIAKLKEIDDEYRGIKKPTQQDVLQYALAALSFIDDILEKFRISPHGGLPTPLLLVLADLINVSQGRLGPLVSPGDKVIANANGVHDNYKDRVRMTIRAYAASTVHRLIKSGQMRSNEEAYRRVADVLEKAGFRASGKRNPINSEVVRSWYEQALTEDCSFADEYQQALQGEDAEPAPLLDALRRAVQPLIFERGSREQSS